MEADIVDNGALNRDRLDLCIEAVWLSVIFLIPVYVNPFGYASFSVAKSLVLHFLASLLLGLALAQWFLGGRGIKYDLKSSKLKMQPLIAAVLIYGLLWGLATACSIMPERSFWGNQVRETGLVTLLSWMVFFMVIAQKMRRREQVYRALYALLISAALVSLLGIVQFSLGWRLLNGRVYSTDGNPLQLSAFLSMVIPFNLAMLIMAWYSYKDGRRNLLKFAAALAVSMLILVCLVLAQYSLTLLLYVLGIFVFFGLAGIYLRQRATLGMALSALLLLAAVALVLMGQLFISSGTTPSPEEVSSASTISEQVGLTTLGIRMQVWESAIKVLWELPQVPFHQDNFHFLRRITGYGPGTLGVVTQSEFPALLRSKYTSQDILLGQPENYYLYLAATNGIPGLLAFLAVLGLFFYTGLRLLRRAKERSLILLAAACLAAVFQYCVHLFFNPATIDPDMVFWLSLGLIPALARIEADESKQTAPQSDSMVMGGNADSRFTAGWGRKALAACIFLVCIGVGMMLTAKPFLADLKLRSAINSFSLNDKQAALARYVEATDIEPRQPAYHGSLGRAAYLMAQQTGNSGEKSHLLELSEIAYGEASRLESGIAFWHYTMGDIYTYRMLHGESGKWADALHAYETADGLFPDNAVILNKWALALMLGGDYEEAGQKLKEAQRSDPDWAQTYYYNGLLLMLEGQPCEGVEMLARPFKAGKPVFEDLSYFMDFCRTADLCGRMGMITDSLRSCQREIRGDWIKLSQLGIAETYVKNPRGAIEAFSQSVEIVPPESATVQAGMIRSIFPTGSPWRAEAERIAGRLTEKASRAK